MSIKKELRSDLAEEKEAKVGYNKLAKELRKKGHKKSAITVKAIARDEADHFKKLRKISKKLK